ncbi:MAG: hypothetical protein IJS14_00895 [Lentisphaeria bacterium]|nr:hypothetical protein [Lentisphaeria bacterium]
MKPHGFSSAVPAVLTVMGVILSWCSLRFPETVPGGFKLIFLSALMILWLARLAAEKFSRPLAGRLDLLTAGFAAAFYVLAAAETFRLFRIHHRPGCDFAVLAGSMVIAAAALVFSLTACPAGEGEEK